MTSTASRWLFPVLLVTALSFTTACNRRAKQLGAALDGVERTDEKEHASGVSELTDLLNKRELRDRDVAPHKPRVAALLTAKLAQLAPLQRSEPTTCASFVAAPGYSELREEAELFLDLAGYAKSPALLSALETALTLSDRRLKYFAVRSLVRQGIPVDARVVADVAKSDDVRGDLYDFLVEHGHSELFPAELRTQEAFARADMVHWLTFPTELGCEPDEMELVKPVSADEGRFYVFKFRKREDVKDGDDGWEAGIAGPFPKNGGIEKSGSSTFSQFEPIGKRTPEEHVAQIRGDIAKAGKP